MSNLAVILVDFFTSYKIKIHRGHYNLKISTMMKKYYAILLFIAIIVSSTNDVYAFSCRKISGKEQVKSADVIFKGRPITSHELTDEEKKHSPHHSYTTFKVQEVFKGNVPDGFNIHHTKSTWGWGPGGFKPEHSYIIFAKRNQKQGTYSVGLCTPTVNLSYKENSGLYIPSRIEIERYQSLKAGFDRLIAEHDDHRMYEAKAKLLEEYNDFEQLVIFYESILKKAHERDKQAVLEKMAERPQSANGAKSMYRKAYRCVNGDGQNTIPYFLRSFSGPAKSGYILGRIQRDYMYAYGRALFMADRFQDAFLPLCFAGMRKDAVRLREQALVHSKNKSRINNRSLFLPDITFIDVDLSGMSLERSNFSNSTFKQVHLVNTNLVGSDFSGSSLSIVSANNVNLSGAKLLKTKLNGKFLDSDLSYVDGQDSILSGDFTGSNMQRADLRGARIISNLTGVDLSHANLEGAYIQDLSGADLEGANLNKINSTGGYSSFLSNFSGVKLAGFDLARSNLNDTDFTNADFRGANLTGASLKGAKFHGVDFSGAILDGADFSGNSYKHANADLSNADLSKASLVGTNFVAVRYNCGTKFPPGFDPVRQLMIFVNDCSKAQQLNNRAPPEPFNLSRKNLLEPPYKHYRLMGEVMSSMWLKDIDLEGASFEGLKINRFINTNLSNTNFRHTTGGMGLYSSNLQGADLSYSNFSRFLLMDDGSSLKGTKFYCTKIGFLSDKDGRIAEADLTGAMFRGFNSGHWPFKFNPIRRKILFRSMQKMIDRYGPADYSNMDFSGCNIADVAFGTTNLSNTKYKGALLGGANFNKANIQGANFDGARVLTNKVFPAGFNEEQFKLVPTALFYETGSPWQASSKSDFQPKNQFSYLLSYKTPSFVNDNLDGLNYTGAWLPGTLMDGASLKFTNFSASNLKEASFKGADLTGAVLYDALLDKADFEKANLYGVDLRWAHMPSVNFEGANLTNAIYDQNTVWPSNFDPKEAGAYYIETKVKQQKATSKKTSSLPNEDIFTNLPKETEVHVISPYNVQHEDGGRCGDRAYIRVCTVNVSVFKKGKPVFLVLSSRGPTRWKIKISPNTEVVGVLASGFERQEIIGIPGSVKVVNYSGQRRYIDRIFNASSAHDEAYRKMENIVRFLTGKSVDYYQNRQSEHGFVIE